MMSRGNLLSKVIMPKKNHHLGMMCPERLRHVGHNWLDIRISCTGFLVAD